jgi:hypothetical protein
MCDFALPSFQNSKTKIPLKFQDIGLEDLDHQGKLHLLRLEACRCSPNHSCFFFSCDVCYQNIWVFSDDVVNIGQFNRETAIP